ncbi:MAG: sigma-54-dependent Fis family transcriptional regulator [Deltaproteobacteria bacterium]|nr:sigma-54-dependent Fis family transcriptional regulator [Deltaproteobacteria bacterium]
MKNTVLICDDDRAHRTMLRALLSGWGYDITEASDGSEAIDQAHQQAFDLILMDIRMAGVSGLEALNEIKAYNPAIPVIIMTAFASVETAVDALKSGAYDYLTKPLDFDELKIAMQRAMDHAHLRKENRILKESLSNRFDRRDIIGRSAAMTSLLDTVVHIAGSDATVLITGESGTGKEVIASAIHFNSPRKEGPFIRINCAAITETLLESELFGHEKGSFTGADRKREGKFRLADHGTLFLDEVSEMSPGMQAKLLRVLQEREITPVGGDLVIKVDVRLVTATNRDLFQEIRENRFREDLYYRLNVVSLTLPPLRDRREDIPLLAHHFLSQFVEKNRKNIKGFTPSAMDHLLKYDWPGNVRELMNVVERGVVLTRTDYLDTENMPLIHGVSPLTPTVDPDASGAGFTSIGTTSLEEVEKETILKTLDLVKGNKSEAARRLGITRRTLHQKLKKYGFM